MTISERTLRKWRKEALANFDPKMYEGTKHLSVAMAFAIARLRILRLTQELLDQHLLRK